MKINNHLVASEIKNNMIYYIISFQEIHTLLSLIKKAKKPEKSKRKSVPADVKDKKNSAKKSSSESVNKKDIDRKKEKQKEKSVDIEVLYSS